MRISNTPFAEPGAHRPPARPTYKKPLSLLLVFALCLSAALPATPAAAARQAPLKPQEKRPMRMKAGVFPKRVKTKTPLVDLVDAAGLKVAGDSQETLSDVALAQTGAQTYAVFNLEFKDEQSRKAFNVPDASVFSAFKRFADVFVPTKRAPNGTIVIDPTVTQAIGSAPGLVWYEQASLATAPPPPPAAIGPATQAIPDRIVRGGVDVGGVKLTGKGVVIAIVDTGVDFRNPDFITYDSQGVPTSRIKYLWDTLSPYDPSKPGNKPDISYPNGAPIGTIYTNQQLNEELRAGRKLIPTTDYNGHGTACAGVAAGNGNNSKGPDGKLRNEVLGVAPEANIIAVRVGGIPQPGGGASIAIENSFLLGAVCDWLDALAGGAPLVVSCSFGGHRGAHDGSRIAERRLNERFPLDGVGRALLIAAGNEGATPLHAEATFGAGGKIAYVQWSARSSGRLEVYLDRANNDDVEITPDELTNLTVGNGEQNPFTGRFSTYVLIEQGSGGMYLRSRSKTPTVADIYISGGSFDAGSAAYGKIIGSPGTTANAITVGSYDWNDLFDGGSLQDFCSGAQDLTIGDISCYSSIGYSRGGPPLTIKPDIVAPGEIYHASYSKLLDGTGANSARATVDGSGNYRLFNGTSAATPYTAGVVALMMQKKPGGTLREIKALLKDHAGKDRFTTPQTPNTKWGYGKLNLAAVQEIMGAIR